MSRGGTTAREAEEMSAMGGGMGMGRRRTGARAIMKGWRYRTRMGDGRRSVVTIRGARRFCLHFTSFYCTGSRAIVLYSLDESQLQ